MIYMIAGELTQLNVYVVYRTVFLNKEEAQKFFDKELSTYTFLHTTPMTDVMKQVKYYKDNTVFVPLVPQKMTGDT
jgi:predicted glycosyltransferase involved in capsule biosynthesis